MGERREKRGGLAGGDVISEIRTAVGVRGCGEERRKKTEEKVNRTKRGHGWENGNE